MGGADRMVRVASRSNAQFIELRALAKSARERELKRRTVLDGPHLVTSYVERGGSPRLVAVSEDRSGLPEIAALLERTRDCPQVCFKSELFRQLAPVDSPVGIVALIDTPQTDTAHALGDLVVLLEGIQDPGNVGTIIRAAAAADADDVLLSRGCADAWSPRTLRAGMGAHFALRVHTDVDLNSAVRRFSGTCIATRGAGGLPPQAVDMRGRVALLFGSEGAGVSEALARQARSRVSIPLARGIESLNVGVAAAVVLFERVRQLSVGGHGRARR